MRIPANNHGDWHPTDAQLVLALDAELEARELGMVNAHREACLACREKCAQWTALSEEIVEYHRSFAPIPAASALPADMERLAVRNRAPGLRTWWKSLVSPQAVAVFGAAVLAVLMISWLGSRPSAAPAPQRAAAKPPAAAPLWHAAAARNAVNPAGVALVRRPSRRGQPPVARVDEGNFISLPYSDAALPLSGATMLRVQLPVEDLWLAGVMVEGGQAGAMVQADIIMGVDGLPRAMRLID